jgi:hypothetical protein
MRPAIAEPAFAARHGGLLAEGSEEERLAGPGGPADDQVLPPVYPFQGAQRGPGGRGIKNSAWSQALKVSPVGNGPPSPGSAGRRRRRVGRQREGSDVNDLALR